MQRTKEQIAKGTKNLEEVKRLRTFVKDTFYPQLSTTATSIEDSKYLLTSLGNMIMQEFLALMKEKKFAELNLVSKLDPKSPQYDEFVKLLNLLNEETVYSARELIEGMSQEIDTNVNNELKSRKLDTLKMNWYES
jgi:hypothetical protein